MKFIVIHEDGAVSSTAHRVAAFDGATTLDQMAAWLGGVEGSKRPSIRLVEDSAMKPKASS